MALSSVNFIEGQGGLGRALDSQDHISGLVFYTATLPSGFATTSTATRTKALYSTQDAINAGIKNDYSDATSATGVVTVTGIGANADTIAIKVADIDATGTAQTTIIGTYTKVAADASVTLVAAGIVAAINTGTSTHGYSATNALGVITITAPKKFGSFLNTGTPLSVTIVGTLAAAVTTAFAGGVSSQFAIQYYHIAEFFRANPKGIFWVGYFAVPGTYTFTELTDMNNQAGGSLRRVGVYKDAVWASADVTALSAIVTANKALYQGFTAFYAANLQATTDITTITDLSTFTANGTLSVISQDGSYQGNFLYKTSAVAGTPKSITNIGLILGTKSARKVSESIAWVEKCNLSNGTECETPAFANGQLVSALAYSALDALDSKRHVFMRKYNGYSGTYFTSSNMCIASNSDYATLENNDVIIKAERNLYAAYVPKLNSPIQFNANGTMTDTTVAIFEGVGNVALDQMVRDAEISAKSVTINPSQNVVATSTLTIAVKLVINGIAKIINIPIGFTPKIS